MKPLTSNEIRNMWLNFFKSKGHKIEEGASLIPHNDPTLLWINSGVAALKKYFDGSLVPPSKRITNVQKSIRTNDIENVGHTARHHTFFEMLGNFSIGDYFRNEVIPWAFEILTSEKYFAMDKEKLYFTYFPTDLETKKLWLAQGVNEDHLIPLEHNYWEIGEGPCGPNTEVFFDRGEKYDPDNIGIKLLKEDLENDRYIEIWGIVFSQFNAENGVKREDYKELPSKNIDTGSGLERICCILQQTETNFETDLFLPIIKGVEKISKKKYEGEYRSSFRVIVDHIRACTFALSDGESFSNEGRGYVLRRLLRRAMRYGHKIGINNPFMYRLVPVVIDIMKSFYPNLINNQERIIKTIKAEEGKFLKTLDNGELILKKMIKDKATISGSDAFKLYDTYGFPFELTLEIALEEGITINKNEFDKEMKKQKELARSSRNEVNSMSRQSKDLMDFNKKSVFTYGFEPIKARVIGLFKDGVKVDSITSYGDVIFDETIFYAESGGQVFDQGEISSSSCFAKVLNVIKAPNHQHLHHISIDYGEIKIDDEFTLSLNKSRRLSVTRSHSATHLLQAVLDDVLSEDIAQAGSFVGEDYVHFDFNFNRKISEEELSIIERKVNELIALSIPQEILILPIEEAKKLGAKCLFDEKYDDIVRVVTFGDLSKEFCGGTHVNNTSDIGCFVIESEESVASGVRRIRFKTSFNAYDFISKKDALLSNVRKNLNIASNTEILIKLSTLNANLEDMKKNYENISSKLASTISKSLQADFFDLSSYKVLVKYLPNISRDLLVSIVDNLKTVHSDYIILLVGQSEINYPIVCSIGGSALKNNKAGLLVSTLAKSLLGSGGGRNDFASGAGKDISLFNEGQKAVINIVK